MDQALVPISHRPALLRSSPASTRGSYSPDAARFLLTALRRDRRDIRLFRSGIGVRFTPSPAQPFGDDGPRSFSC